MVDSGNNGNGDGHGGRDVTHMLLERIARAVENTNERMDRLEKRVDQGFADVKGELVQVNGRLDHVLQLAGKHHANHEQRIGALEAEVFKKSG